jgi:hypothetical protein
MSILSKLWNRNRKPITDALVAAVRAKYPEAAPAIDELAQIAATTPEDVKPGVQTTEFWVTAAALVFGAALTAGVIPHAPEVHTAVEAVAALLVALGYTWARAFTKRAK